MIIDKVENFMDKMKIKLKIYCQYYNIKNYLQVRKYKRLYPDYIDDEYNNGSLKFIWGIISWDDLTGKDANLHTMNDIDIIYDRDTKLYMLGIETAWIFDGNAEEIKKGECRYLRQLLNAFAKFMDDNGYLKDYGTCLFMRRPQLEDSAESIGELYFNFRVFVEGYCKVCGC